MGKKIYFGSFKGGTGVTTCCVGLGLALADMGERTLIIDGDSLSACAMIVAGLGNMQVYTLADFERAACRAKQAMTAHPKASNLYIMPSLGMKNLQTAKRALDEVEGLFDFVLCDKILPEFCDRACIVSEPFIPSVKSAEICRAALADSGIKEIVLAVNKVNGGQVINGEIYSPEQIADILRLKLFAAIPEDLTLPSGKWRRNTVQAFAIAAKNLTGKNDDLYDVLRGFTGLNGFIKRKLRA